MGDSNRPTFQIRVPMDDTHTLHYWYDTKQLGPARSAEAGGRADLRQPVFHDDGKLVVETVNGQDMMAWVTQGPISLREAERLGTSDKGVIFYRSVLMEQMEKVARGEDPMGTVRDPAENEMIVIPRESVALAAFQQKRDVIADVFQEVVGTRR